MPYYLFILNFEFLLAPLRLMYLYSPQQKAPPQTETGLLFFTSKF